jgi:hypothetical protein
MSDEFSPPCFWSCSKDEPLGSISRALGIPETFCVEISAHGWEDETVVMDELARAFSFPEHFGRNWDAAGDCLGEFLADRPRCVVIVRDIPTSDAGRAAVAVLADLIGPESPALLAKILVLDAWERPDIDLKLRTVPIRPLKTS